MYELSLGVLRAVTSVSLGYGYDEPGRDGVHLDCYDAINWTLTDYGRRF